MQQLGQQAKAQKHSLRRSKNNIISSASVHQSQIPTTEVLWLTLLTCGANQHAAPRGNTWRWSRGWCHVRYWAPGLLRRSLLEAIKNKINSHMPARAQHHRVFLLRGSQGRKYFNETTNLYTSLQEKCDVIILTRRLVFRVCLHNRRPLCWRIGASLVIFILLFSRSNPKGFSSMGIGS